MRRLVRIIAIVLIGATFSGCVYLLYPQFRYKSFNTQYPEYRAVEFRESIKLSSAYKLNESTYLDTFFTLWVIESNKQRLESIDSERDNITKLINQIYRTCSVDIPDESTHFVHQMSFVIEYVDTVSQVVSERSVFRTDTLLASTIAIRPPRGIGVTLDKKHEIILRKFLHSRDYKKSFKKANFLRPYINVVDGARELDRNLWAIPSNPWIERIVVNQEESEAIVGYYIQTSLYGQKSFVKKGDDWIPGDIDRIIAF